MTNSLFDSRLRIEIASFWFGPTPSGRIALLSSILFGGDPSQHGSIAARLAAEIYEERNQHGVQIICAPQRNPEQDEYARLHHWQIRIEGRESFHSNFGFIPRFEHKAIRAGLRCAACHPFWAASDATLPYSSWPPSEAKSHAEYIALSENIAAHNHLAKTRKTL